MGVQNHISAADCHLRTKNKRLPTNIKSAESLYLSLFPHILWEWIVSKCGFTYPMEYQVLKFRIYSLSNTYINWLANIICSIASLFVHERFS